ncbi:selection and upkeep of intraepithelial T-cells protein 1-like [Paralichthys olivaceus]|uniref:selection and upkeep of intraepithelial T-cells protein 1-like n=1 Tax=Paralichthys olivaceus TaxID=8255 RepID=UPI00097CE8C7|nr:PREDICTED: uncharacterized protein LOC109644088 [Paralichthys olivaceus]
MVGAQMERARVAFFCSCTVLLLLAPATGKPLGPDLPLQVFVAVGEDGVLPCRSNILVNPSRVTLEWSRVDGPSTRTLYVLRDGHELEREKSAEYIGRTTTTGDGSLKLQRVSRQDSDIYRCKVFSKSSGEDEVFVSLVVVVLSDVNITVQWTSSNQLLVQCESRGWSPEPQIDLLNTARDVLPTQKEGPSLGPDQLYSCGAHLDVVAANVSGTVICRVHIPGSSLGQEQSISVPHHFHHISEKSHKYWIAMLVLIPIIIIFLWLLHHRDVFTHNINNLKSWWLFTGGVDRYKAHGDILKMKTTGASSLTVNENRENLIVNDKLLTGEDASNELARRDHMEMMKYQEDIISVAESHKVHPALIAAIISRQSQAGTILDPSGFGKYDPNCFGLMQINKFYHELKGSSHSREHLNQGVILLFKLIEAVGRVKTSWTKEQQLKGALACYISGEDKVLPLTDSEEVDSVTPHKDFASDVLARAKWFASNGFGKS